MKLTKLLILSKYNYLKMMQSNIISFLSYFLKYNKSTSTFYFHTCIFPTSVSGAMILIWTTVSNVMSMCCKMTTFKLVIIYFTTERQSLKTEGDDQAAFAHFGDVSHFTFQVVYISYRVNSACIFVL